ncbi:hypothetical protein P152DRAFT_265305 [Eremomyces bilateralis CBS 781.70]|uniref:Uncharacterized protein n=1 Tax=Eremomyces bilateralis CBS 781.70 TaxID=1392243 RepID=A0A6G1G847_9PEZI|nr:uncharacterized protein P152DRAFT_265305 [Eremomyces bilateralis CBS 781.70]KAF1814238.1 hypothetical protein P152DRAFT_265305 [Eremomyces bilateralis CBS 781.70]
MDKVQKALDDLERKATKSVKIISKGEKLSVGDAIKLGRKTNSMISTMKKAVKGYEGTTPTEEESQKILAQSKRMVELSEAQLDHLISLKPHIEKLHVGGLVKKSMLRTQAASGELENVMREKSPENLKAEGEALAKRKQAVFEKALAAFANSTGGEDQAEGEDDSD